MSVGQAETVATVEFPFIGHERAAHHAFFTVLSKLGWVGQVVALAFFAGGGG